MAEYIDRKKLFERLKEETQDYDAVGKYKEGIIKGLNIAKSIVNDPARTPTEDVVPVVRCENCKHCRKDTYFDYCDKYSRPFDKLYVEKDHYCSYGERKE